MLALAEYNKTPYDLTSRNVTISELYEQWIEKRQKDGDISELTLRNVKSNYKKLDPIHDKPIKDLRTDHLQGLIDELDLKASSKKQVFSVLRQLFDYAMKKDIIIKDYSQHVTIKDKEPAKKARTVFTAAEIQSLWENYKDIDYMDVPLILIYSGMRINELLSLEKASVNLKERYIKAGSKTKAGKGADGQGRIIPIHNKIMPLIKHRMSMEGDYLIMSKRGKKMQYTHFQKYNWAEIMGAINTSHTTHDCRATFASLIDNTDANKLAIKRILGHADENITEHYTHKDISDLIEAVNKI